MLNMKSFQVKKSSLCGAIESSPSKSHTLRAILFASLAKGKSTITHYLLSPDANAMLDTCRQLGAAITVTSELITIEGVEGKIKIPDDVINAGNSGQVLRFVAAIAALNSNYMVFTGDHSVRHNRPMQALIDGLRGLGAFCISTKNDGYAPVIVKGPIKAGITKLSGEDSQPVSALLMATAFLPDKTEIIVKNAGEKPWIDLSLFWLRKLGAQIENHNYERYIIHGGLKYNGFDYSVPGDFSSVQFPIVAALATNSEISIQYVDMDDVQGDKKVIEVLRSMGAKIEYDSKMQLLTIKPSQLIGGEIDANDFVDSVPILAVLGCFAKGKTRIFNAAVARTKECDRIFAIATELKKMGAKIEEFADGLVIERSELHGATVDTYHDHRMVMSLCVAGFFAEGITVVNDIKSVTKSYPSFYADMKKLGADIGVIE
jgi:3-phosphoshikimate 1-carboxyvinyltransferase